MSATQLVTYPCRNCSLYRMEPDTGAYTCRSDHAECERCRETDRIESMLYETVALFSHRHISDDTRSDIAHGMFAGFESALAAQDAGLDEVAFLHECGVRG
jgi:hypothetical protein